MQVLRLHSTDGLRLHDEPVPSPSEGEELLRITAVGICGSDLHWLEEGSIGDAVLGSPLVLGHEFAAVVASGKREGLRVAVDPSIPCGQCRYCRDGNTNLCSGLRFAGHGSEDGALRTFMAWPARRLHAIPDSFSDEAGALLEPLGVAIHAVDLGKIKDGSRVGIFGCGPIGLLIAQVAIARGAKIVLATEPVAIRREAALLFGAAIALDPKAKGFPEELRRASAPDGLDVAFEASNDSRAVQDAVDAVRPGGRVVVTGIPSDDRILLQASTVRRKGLTLLLTRRMREVYDRAIDLVARRKVDLDGLVTHRFDLSAFPEAFDTAQRRTGHKVIIKP